MIRPHARYRAHLPVQVPGPPLRAWHLHRVIPLRAKILAVSMMAASLAFVTLVVADGWLVPVLMAAVMVPVCFYLLSRDSTVPRAEA